MPRSRNGVYFAGKNAGFSRRRLSGDSVEGGGVAVNLRFFCCLFPAATQIIFIFRAG